MGVAIATIVSSTETILCKPSRIRLLHAWRSPPSPLAGFFAGAEFGLGVWRPIFINEYLLNDTDDVAGQPVQKQPAALRPEHEGEHHRHDHHHLSLRWIYVGLR